MEAKLALIATLIVLFTAYQSPQDDASSREQFSGVQDLLGLSDSQTMQLEDIFQSAKSACTYSDAFSDCMRDQRQDMDTRIAAILISD